jgi:D-alanyl-lipoteichoic acid acyltransferase DltB (MBOAT superfamily)
MIERLKDILFFSDQHPMIFTGLDFWIFFLVVFSGFALLNKKVTLRNFYLMAVSWFFYYKTSGFFLILLVLTSVSSYGAAYLIHQIDDKLQRKVLLGFSVVFQLFILAYFKYAYFFADTLNSLLGTNISVLNHIAMFANSVVNEQVFTVEKILLPVGISFFTFQTITYITDVYREKLEPVESFFDYSFYVSFFPQLVAGPIVRASEFIPQIFNKSNITKYEFGTALFMILKGLFKKIFIGDYLAVNFIDRVFNNPLSFTGFENLSALFAYSLQVYVDFSGYTDIAIGVSLLMGFKLHPNFQSPYKAQSVADFWRRWHISLSRFLKDYLYIPLGGNQHGQIRTNVNLMITMLLGGLWHGASWNFVIWGALNGAALLIYKNWKKISPYEKIKTAPVIVWKIAFTFTFITFTRVFFRAPDLQIVQDFFTQLFGNFGWEVIPKFFITFKYVWLVMILGFVTHWLPESLKNKWKDNFIESPFVIQVLISVLVIFIIYQSISSELQPFIYFQF